MKYIFPAFVLLAGLAGCAHDEPTPAPALVGGTWTLQTEVFQATPVDGSPAYTQTVAPMTGPVTLTYRDETHFQLEVQLGTGTSHQHFESTYSYQGTVLRFTAIYNWNTRFIVPRTVEVTELSAHRLVMAEKWDGSDTHYLTTHTFSR